MLTNDFAVKGCYYESARHGKYEDEVEGKSGKGTCVEVRHPSRLGENIRRQRVLIVVIPILI